MFCETRGFAVLTGHGAIKGGKRFLAPIRMSGASDAVFAAAEESDGEDNDWTEYIRIFLADF